MYKGNLYKNKGLYNHVGLFNSYGLISSLPLIPTGLILVVDSDTQITVSCTTSYAWEIWRSTAELGTYTLVTTVSKGTLSYANTDLTQGTQYFYKIRSKNGSKYSAFSAASSATTVLLAPTVLTSQFVVDTILGQVDFTDNSGGVAQHEVYSNTNGAGAVLLTTLATGIVTYNDTTCKQNASVVYTVRAKKGTIYSTYATASALVTPLCWKTNQTVRTNVVINQLTIAAGKTVNVDWGDGTNADYTGGNTNITKTYAASATNVFNIKMSGDLNNIASIQHYDQLKSYGEITNWILPTNIISLYIRGNSFTGDVTNILLPTSLSQILFNASLLVGDWTNKTSATAFSLLYLYNSQFTGKLPNINSVSYQLQTNNFSGTNVTTFNVAMTIFNIKDQRVSFPTVEIDKLLKALADFYEVNSPTANCTFDMSGASMGIPTGGSSNVDLLRLASYYVAAGKTPTIVIRTS